MPESANSTKEEVVLKLAEALKVPITPQDVEISHKLKRKGKKAIIVKFANHKIKSNIYKSRAKLKNIQVSSLFPSVNTATHAAGDHIFLHEHAKCLDPRWKIYVKTSPEGRLIKINNLEYLENL